MRFHNAALSVYRARMVFAAPRTLLARLRSSARLAALVLLVFTLKMGAAAACAKHDFADMGLGTGGGQTMDLKVVALDSTEADPTQVNLGHAGTCTHCGCHHAAAVVPIEYFSLALVANALTDRPAGLPPGASPPLELRPPIA